MVNAENRICPNFAQHCIGGPWPNGEENEEVPKLARLYIQLKPTIPELLQPFMLGAEFTFQAGFRASLNG